jgi:putative ABC transport system permease protein
MRSWLQNRAYHTDLNILIFIFSAPISQFLAFLSVCFQSAKAALSDPGDSLKYE